LFSKVIAIIDKSTAEQNRKRKREQAEGPEKPPPFELPEAHPEPERASVDPCTPRNHPILDAALARGVDIDGIQTSEHGDTFRVSTIKCSTHRVTGFDLPHVKVLSQGRISHMQDDIFIWKTNGGLGYLVIDGHGHDAELVSDAFRRVIMDTFDAILPSDAFSARQVEIAMDAAFRRAQEFHTSRRLAGDKNFRHNGFAALLVFIKHGHMYTFHCGDCEAQVWNKDGLRFHTPGHNIISMTEKERASFLDRHASKGVSIEEGSPSYSWGHCEEFEMFASLGSMGLEDVTLRTGQFSQAALEPGDRLLFTTDGLLKLEDYPRSLDLGGLPEDLYSFTLDWVIKNATKFRDNTGFFLSDKIREGMRILA
jgi:serine/threonine protein phosphatase PrpC